MRIGRRQAIATAAAGLLPGCTLSLGGSDDEGEDDRKRHVQLRNDHDETHSLTVELPREGDQPPVLMMNARLEPGDETDRREISLDGVGDDPKLYTELDGGPRDTHDLPSKFSELTVRVTEEGILAVETTDE